MHIRTYTALSSLFTKGTVPFDIPCVQTPCFMYTYVSLYACLSAICPLSQSIQCKPQASRVYPLSLNSCVCVLGRGGGHHSTVSILTSQCIWMYMFVYAAHVLLKIGCVWYIIVWGCAIMQSTVVWLTSQCYHWTASCVYILNYRVSGVCSSPCGVGVGDVIVEECEVVHADLCMHVAVLPPMKSCYSLCS